jgi:hypothetical protein
VQQSQQLLVWGGTDAATGGAETFFADGAIYDADAGTWRSMAPSPIAARAYGTAVWTGGELFVWGGRGATGLLGDGALYNPATDSWRMIGDLAAPSPRAGYVAALAGSDVIVHSGDCGAGACTDGARFTPTMNVWAAMQANPGAGNPAFAFTGTALLEFAGRGSMACGGGANALDSLSIYDAAMNQWQTSAATAGVPAARWFGGPSDCTSRAWPGPWTGSAMFVWGGMSPAGLASGGGLYVPTRDAWTAPAAAPAALASGVFLPVVVWTGSRILGWSVVDASGPQDIVFQYDPVGDAWATPTYSGAPTPVFDGAALGWTGRELIVWGGLTGGGVSGLGGRLAP